MPEKIEVYDGLFNLPPDSPLVCDDKSRTQQQFKDEADINWIVKRYADTPGFVDPTIPVTRQPVYGDFSDCPSFQEHQDKLNNIVNIFDSFPSEIRAKFDNNPAVFAEFASDVKNLDTLADIGLIDRPKNENVNHEVDIKETTPPEPSDSGATD